MSGGLIEALGAAVQGARLVDLSYTMEAGMPAWPTHARYGSLPYESTEWGDGSFHAMITLSEHSGTHIDAPKHFIPGGTPVDGLPVNAVMGRGVCLDAAFLKPREALTAAQIREFEGRQGEIRRGDIVLIRFGWDERYGVQPDCGPFLRDWPGLGGDGAVYLAEKGVAAVGCDTLALDPFGVSEYQSHGILLGGGIPIIEELYGLKGLPPFCYVIGLWNKFKGGSGSPIRVVAFVEQSGQGKGR